MKYLYSFLILMLISLASCEGNQKKELPTIPTPNYSLEGNWFKEGSDKRAFSIQGDSMYFLGLKSGYHYEIVEDTLWIHFTNQVTKNQIISQKGNRLVIWDASLTQDTITLIRKGTKPIH